MVTKHQAYQEYIHIFKIVIFVIKFLISVLEKISIFGLSFKELKQKMKEKFGFRQLHENRILD